MSFWRGFKFLGCRRWPLVDGQGTAAVCISAFNSFFRWSSLLVSSFDFRYIYCSEKRNVSDSGLWLLSTVTWLISTVWKQVLPCLIFFQHHLVFHKCSFRFLSPICTNLSYCVWHNCDNGPKSFTAAQRHCTLLYICMVCTWWALDCPFRLQIHCKSLLWNCHVSSFWISFERWISSLWIAFKTEKNLQLFSHTFLNKFTFCSQNSVWKERF